MPAAGDDLREYLIVPPACSPPPSSSYFHQLAGLQSASDLNPDSPRFDNRRPESANMEVDYPTFPNTLSSAHTMDGVMSIDDFLSANQEDHDAFVAARQVANGPPTKKSKTKPSMPIQPIAVGARSSQHTVRLHDLSQKLAISQPVFTYTGDGVTKFTVELSFPGLDDAEELQGLKEEGRFNSKQEAKEALCKSALAILERLVEDGRVAKAGKAKKPKGGPAQQQPKEKEEPGENYVGQLLEFQRATGAPQPTYTDYQLGTRWACLAELEGHGAPFSSLDTLFGSKKLARQHAAGCVVAHFKSAGTWPSKFTDVGGIKKRKSAVASPTHCSLDSRKASVASTSTAGATSATSQVASLAHMLNLCTPEYRFTYPDSSVSDIHTVSCYFKDGGVHEGPIGEVRNIFGKKNAKNECARKTLEYLAEVKRQREEVANRLIAAIKGGVAIPSAGVGMVVNGEENMEGGEDELDIYEDAMEY